MLRTTLVLALALAGAAPAMAADEPAAAALSAPAVTVVAADVRELAETVVVTGTVVPRERVSVGVDVDGLRIRELLVDEGDVVEAGAVLARLSTDTIEIQLAQSDSQLARAEAAIAQARTQIAEAEAAEREAVAALARAEALTQRGVTSQDVLEQRTAAAASATARLASARQGLALAEADKALTQAQRREIELRLSKTEIKAPTAGLVLQRTARIGAVVSPAGGPLFEIARDGVFELAAEAPETVLARMHAGQPVAVTLAGAREAVAGKVRLVSPQVDEATRLGRVRVALPEGDGLRDGAFARGLVETARSKGVAVPVSAVSGDDRSSSVLLVADGKVRATEVTLGITADGFVEIVEGLSVGDEIVARAGTFLRDGDAVTPVPAQSDEAKG